MNKFSYLEYILLSFDYLSSGVMRLLSKANWPNITKLNLVSRNCVADSIKYLRKHFFFKLERLLFCVENVVCENARRIAKIDCMKVCILSEYEE